MAKVTWTVVVLCVLVPRVEAWVRTGEEVVLVGGFNVVGTEVGPGGGVVGWGWALN